MTDWVYIVSHNVMDAIYRVKSMTTETIQARFGGRDYQFAIPRRYLYIFEADYGSAAAMAARFVAGNWRFEDVRNVIEFAARPSSHFKWADQMPKPLPRGVPVPPSNPHIEATLTDNPPGTYAELALLILTASIYGLERPEDAVFTDEVADAA